MNDKVSVTEEKLKMIATEAVAEGRLERLADELLDEIIKQVIDKNHDYGDAWQRYGIFTPLIRINDKLLRTKTLASTEALVASEKIDETLRDNVGYSLLALLWLKEHPEALSDSGR